MLDRLGIEMRPVDDGLQGHNGALCCEHPTGLVTPVPWYVNVTTWSGSTWVHEQQRRMTQK